MTRETRRRAYGRGRRAEALAAWWLRLKGYRIVARELTKLHEEVRRGTLSELADHYGGAGPPKGEVVVVVGPPERGGRATLDARDLDAKLGAALGRASLRDAVAAVAAETGLPRTRVYARALELAGETADDA